MRYRHVLQTHLTASIQPGRDRHQVVVTWSNGECGATHVATFRRFFRVDLQKDL